MVSREEPAVPVRIVIDTNVFVAAAFRRGGTSHRILRAVTEGRVVHVWHDVTRGETEAIVRRIPPLRPFDLAPFFSSENRHAGSLDRKPYRAVADPSDRWFAALAGSTGSIVVTSDDDLLGPRDQLDITIETPAELARRLGL